MISLMYNPYLFPPFLSTTDFLSLSIFPLNFKFPVSLYLSYQDHISYCSLSISNFPPPPTLPQYVVFHTKYYN